MSSGAAPLKRREPDVETAPEQSPPMDDDMHLLGGEDVADAIADATVPPAPSAPVSSDAVDETPWHFFNSAPEDEWLY